MPRGNSFVSVPAGVQWVRALDLLTGVGMLCLLVFGMILVEPSTISSRARLGDYVFGVLAAAAPGALLAAGILLTSWHAANWCRAMIAQAIAAGGFFVMAGLMIHFAATDPQGGGPSFFMLLFALFLGGIGLFSLGCFACLLTPGVRRAARCALP